MTGPEHFFEKFYLKTLPSSYLKPPIKSTATAVKPYRQALLNMLIYIKKVSIAYEKIIYQSNIKITK